jgi:malonyl-CoA O-methyltransferase
MIDIHPNNQFTKYAKEYEKHNIIQQIISKALIRDITTNPQNILELGSGSGQVYNHINWNFNKYTAIDLSKTMCEIHPQKSNLNIKCLDFDSSEFFDYLNNRYFDIVISSSAMQWSMNLDYLLYKLSGVTNELHAVLFTSNTFRRIYQITRSKSPILDESTIKNAFNKNFKSRFEVFNYKLEFDNKKNMFNYIKKSGVSGKSMLSYKDAKRVYKEYNLNYLEFSVIFVKAFSK